MSLLLYENSKYLYDFQLLYKLSSLAYEEKQTTDGKIITKYVYPVNHCYSGLKHCTTCIAYLSPIIRQFSTFQSGHTVFDTIHYANRVYR
jgi:hypothetical protein